MGWEEFVFSPSDMAELIVILPLNFYVRTLRPSHAVCFVARLVVELSMGSRHQAPFTVT